MDNVFHLRDQVVGEYGQYVRSFLNVRDERIRGLVDEKLDAGVLWPAPLVQLNPRFEDGDELLDRQKLPAVLRFHHGDDWEAILRRHEGLFGKAGRDRDMTW